MGKREKPTEEEWLEQITARNEEGSLILEHAAKYPEANRKEFAEGSARIRAVIDKFRAKLGAARGA
jgi:hypothetical protein